MLTHRRLDENNILLSRFSVQSALGVGFGQVNSMQTGGFLLLLCLGLHRGWLEGGFSALEVTAHLVNSNSCDEVI